MIPHHQQKGRCGAVAYCLHPLAFGEASHKRLNVQRGESKKGECIAVAYCLHPLAFGYAQHGEQARESQSKKKCGCCFGNFLFVVALAILGECFTVS